MNFGSLKRRIEWKDNFDDDIRLLDEASSCEF